MIKFDNSYEFGYEMIGEFRSSGEWIHPRRTINSNEVILVLEGEVCIAENDKRYVLHPDEMIILEAGAEHYGFKASTVPTAFYWFHFHTDMPFPFKTYSGKEVYEVKKQLKRLLHITNTPSYSSQAADALAYLIFEELCRLQSNTSPQNSALVNNITEYIRINILKSITVREISEHFGYNPDYIGKLFKKINGAGLKEYIDAQKMKPAKDMLLTTAKTVKQISAELGFGEENLFIKFFIYHEKVSPTAYRSKYYNTHINNK